MPRGIRALHETQQLHLQSRSEPMVAYIPVADWMPVACWCERSIMCVDQSLVGITTFSCGRPKCQPDDGTESPVGLTVAHLRQLSGVQPVGDACEQAIPAFVRGKVRIVLRSLLDARRVNAERRDRIGAWEVAMRRNDVEREWRRGLRPIDIALAVNADLITILDDMVYLRAQGKLGPKAVKP